MRYFLIVLALLAAPLVGSSTAFAMICTQGQSETESLHTVGQHACYETYFNNSGGALTSGTVVVFDTSGTGVNQSTETGASRADVDVDGTDGDVDNIFTYITTTTTADSELVAGVIDDDSCADQAYCTVQVAGPRLVRVGTTDTTAGDSVCTSTTAGEAGDCGANPDGVLGVTSQSRTVANSIAWVHIDLSRGE